MIIRRFTRTTKPTGTTWITGEVIGLDSFIRNKRAVGRPKDLADIEGL